MDKHAKAVQAALVVIDSLERDCRLCSVIRRSRISSSTKKMTAQAAKKETCDRYTMQNTTCHNHSLTCMNHVCFVGGAYRHNAEGKTGYYAQIHIDWVIREGKVGCVDVER